MNTPRIVPEILPAPAAHGGSSDDSSADSVQLYSTTAAGSHGLERGAVSQRCKSCEDTGEYIRHGLIFCYVDTGQTGCLFVTSDCDDVTSCTCLIEHDAHNHCQNHDPQETQGKFDLAYCQLEQASGPAVGCGSAPARLHWLRRWR